MNLRFQRIFLVKRLVLRNKKSNDRPASRFRWGLVLFFFLEAATQASLASAPSVSSNSQSSSSVVGYSSFEEVKKNLVRSESLILDRNGEVVQENRTDLRFRQIGWTPLKEISPALIQAVLLSEDKRFYQHPGIDWIAVTRALGNNWLGKGKSGASTISMQVVALLNKKLKPKNLRRNWRQKTDQIRDALEMERKWSKEEILETYLNLVSFRGELQGIASASRGLFEKDPGGLNRSESLILAALIRSPQSESNRVLTRACALAEKMKDFSICETLAEMIQKRGLFPLPFPPAVRLAPHFARVLEKRNLLGGGLVPSSSVKSTLDRRLQTQVLEILRRQILSLKDRNMNDGAALVVENQTGEILAYVGSVGDISSAPAVDGVRALRQAGSTLKPFLYDLAIEHKYLTASSKLNDSVRNISLGTGSIYRPKDFDQEYHGSDVTVRLALASSLNVPAVKTLQLIGVGKLVERMRKLGFENLKSEDFYGPSLALGSADVSLLELVNAYRTFANQGFWTELQWIKNDSQKPTREIRKVLMPQSAFIISDILSDPVSRSLTFGLNSPMTQRFWTAVKTGTSKDMRDNWCVGFSENYTVGVWTGNFSGEPMRSVSGVSGAAPVWSEIMSVLHRKGPESSPGNGVPRPPSGVVFAEGEWFLQGTEPSDLDVRNPESSLSAKIVYPVEGLLIARDPDIPTENQRVFFEASSNSPGLQWILNKENLGSVGTSISWQPGAAGNYELQLVSSEGKVLDQIHFQVRN